MCAAQICIGSNVHPIEGRPDGKGFIAAATAASSASASASASADAADATVFS